VTEPDQLHVVTVPQTDPRLGRQVVHDPASRRFAFEAETSPPKRDVQLRVYGPAIRPKQDLGYCTGADAATKCNTVGNRVRGKVLKVADAKAIYSRATQIDPFDGAWPPEDTGSSGLAACKASVELGHVDAYQWNFNGPDGVLAMLHEGHPVGAGTWWLSRMFTPDPETGLVEVSGYVAGGHQWTVVGYRKRYDAFIGHCWWGPDFGKGGNFLIRWADLARLLADDGDAHITRRTGQNA
jgi:hypothetical protein